MSMVREVSLKIVVATVAIAMVFAVVGDAYAGGNKSSSNGKIVVRNNTSAQAGVAIDPSATLQAATTPAEFRAAGGVILNPGESRTFSVRQGKHLLISGTNVSNFKQRSVSVGGGATVNVTVTSISGAIP